MIRLALAAHVLDAWDARGTSIIWLMESCRRLLAPLAVLDAHKLLMVAESSMLASVTGAPPAARRLKRSRARRGLCVFALQVSLFLGWR